nr:hypothetical protein [Cellulosilyticum ruminicola]
MLILRFSSVITDISRKTGITILKSIVSGNTNLVSLSQLACGIAHNKIDELQCALKGSIQEHQRVMLNHQLEHIEMQIIFVHGLELYLNVKKVQERKCLRKYGKVINFLRLQLLNVVEQLLEKRTPTFMQDIKK